MQTDSSLKQYYQFAIKANLFLLIVVPLLLTIFAIFFQKSSLDESHDQQLMRTKLAAQDFGATLSASFAGAFENIDLTLLAATDYIKNQPNLDSFNSNKFNAQLAELQRRIPYLVILRASDNKGDVLYKSDSENTENVNIADRSYFQQSKDDASDRMIISEPVMGRISKKWVIICARRFNLSNGQFGGVVYGSVALDGFIERLSGKPIHLSENDAFVLRDQQSNIIVRYAHGKQDLSETGHTVTSPHIVAFDKSGETSTSYTAHSAIDHVERIFYLERINNRPLSLIVGLSVEDALRTWSFEAQLKWMNTILFIVVVLGSFSLLHIEQFKKFKAIQRLEDTREKLSKVEEELRKQATHDMLTGLPNRRLLMDRLGQAISANKRLETHGALLFLDLNKFKDLNDAYGHEAGDKLLIEVARRMTQLIRESDTVARLGGDEFIVLLLGLDNASELAQKYAEQVAEKIHQRLNETYVLGHIVHHCTVSIGVKVFGEDETPEKILRDADADMYQKKRASET